MKFYFFLYFIICLLVFSYFYIVSIYKQRDYISKEQLIIPSNSILNVYSPSKNANVLLFHPNGYAGIGNNYRAICGLAVLSIAFQSRFCIHWNAYFEAMDDSLQIFNCSDIQEKNLTYVFKVKDWIQNIMTMGKLDMSYKTVTISDLGPVVLNDTKIRKFLYNKGIIQSPFESYDNIYRIIARDLLRPKRELRTYIDSILWSMYPSVSVGVQLRIGGNYSNTPEGHQFIRMEQMPFVLEKISSIIKNIHSKPIIYLSTDSNYTKEWIQQLNLTIVEANRYPSGHSSSNKSRFLHTLYTLRAIVDLHVLTHCDYMIVTGFSSYGILAARMSWGTNKYYF